MPHKDPEHPASRSRLTRASLLGAFLLTGVLSGVLTAFGANAFGAAVATAAPAGAASPATARAQVAAPRSLPGVLRLSTFTDTLPGDAATAYHALSGDAVRRVYVLHNDGLLPLADVSVHDPDVSSSAFSCAEQGDEDETDLGDAYLGPLDWMACSATFAARIGEHESTVTATASSLLMRHLLSAEDVAGYTAIAPGLTAAVTLADGVRSGGELAAGTTVAAAVRIGNSGSARLADLRPIPPQQYSGFSCPAGSVINALAPGESAVCTGTLRVAPGRHGGTLTVTGTWLWDRAITVCGPQPERSFAVETTADASYTGITPPRPPTPAPVPVPRPTPARVQPKPVAVPVPPAPSTPPPSPSASPPRSAAPTPPGHALPQGAVRFVAGRGLSLPLKVLAIVIVPGVAAARRFAARR